MSIHFVNNSTVVDKTSFNQAVTDINIQLSNEFVMAWGLPHVVTTVTLMDEIDEPGALGYHALDPTTFMPYARVAAKVARDNYVPVSLVMSHEVLEMCANPLVNRLALIDPTGTGESGELVWAEVCDAVERGSYPGRLHGTPLSNFVLPGWYVPGWTGPVDHLGNVPGPLQIASGGYIQAESFTGSGWQEYTAWLVQIVNKRKVHYL